MVQTNGSLRTSRRYGSQSWLYCRCRCCRDCWLGGRRSCEPSAFLAALKRVKLLPQQLEHGARAIDSNGGSAHACSTQRCWLRLLAR